MEPNALEKPTSNSIVSLFFVRTQSMIGRFFLRIFSASGWIEKQAITNLSISSSKRFVSIVRCDYEIAFLMEEEDAVFCTFL